MKNLNFALGDAQVGRDPNQKHRQELRTPVVESLLLLRRRRFGGEARIQMAYVSRPRFDDWNNSVKFDFD